MASLGLCCSSLYLPKKMAPLQPCGMSIFWCTWPAFTSRVAASSSSLRPCMHHDQPSSPSKPWRLALYCDEVVPGNVLGRAERKCWCIYASLLEFQHHVSREECWPTLAVERTSFVATLEGQVGQMMAAVLESIFCCPYLDPRYGFQLRHEDHGLRIHFAWEVMVCDGAAHEQVWCSRGDSASKFCLLCANVTSHHMPSQHSQLVLSTDQGVLDSYARLASRKDGCTKAEFDMWQQATGLTFSKKALLLIQKLLAKEVLRPCHQFCHDWMHGVLQGTAPVVMYTTCQAIAKTGFPVWNYLERYCACWTFPAAWKCSHLPILFSKKKIDKHHNNEKFACQASECLSLYPVIRHFLETIAIPQNLAMPACEAFLAMSEAIDQLHGGC